MNDQKWDPADSSLDEAPPQALDPATAQFSSPEEPRKKRNFFKKWLPLIATCVAIAALAIAIAAFRPSKTEQKPTQVTVQTQSLDNGTLNKLVQQNSNNNSGTQTQLVITSDTTFNGDVAIERNLSVGGNTTLQGATTVNSNLAVNGNLSVSGQISGGSLNVGSLNVTNVNASGNVVFNGHLVPGGSTPAVKTSVAAGSGSATINGNDTAGTVTINVTGTTTGELAIITFTRSFNGTPKVQLTPVNADSAKLQYYVTRSAGFFTINTANAPTNGASYVFDYLATQ